MPGRACEWFNVFICRTSHVRRDHIVSADLFPVDLRAAGRVKPGRLLQ
jgi:hypothetical protein